MSDLTGEVGTMTFNTRGNLLAVGFKENGGIKVISYPSMKTLVEWRLQDPEVKDVDWCHAPGLQQELLAAVASDGTCQLWGIGQEGVKMQAQLEPPKGEQLVRQNASCWPDDVVVLLSRRWRMDEALHWLCSSCFQWNTETPWPTTWHQGHGTELLSTAMSKCLDQ
eukprot:GHRR01036522.1.p1 GENE.GHRR01036522.1~~GHRR01036522.1.p1  ORF type:complete len:166 (+),score=41.27 GHRR01036522.1:204-701(+)